MSDHKLTETVIYIKKNLIKTKSTSPNDYQTEFLENWPFLEVFRNFQANETNIIRMLRIFDFLSQIKNKHP